MFSNYSTVSLTGLQSQLLAPIPSCLPPLSTVPVICLWRCILHHVTEIISLKCNFIGGEIGCLLGFFPPPLWWPDYQCSSTHLCTDSLRRDKLHSWGRRSRRNKHLEGQNLLLRKHYLEGLLWVTCCGAGCLWEHWEKLCQARFRVPEELCAWLATPALHVGLVTSNSCFPNSRFHGTVTQTTLVILAGKGVVQRFTLWHQSPSVGEGSSLSLWRHLYRTGLMMVEPLSRACKAQDPCSAELAAGTKEWSPFLHW